MFENNKKSNKMKRLYLIADYNDADYSECVVKIDEEKFKHYLPLIKAINNFKPYVSKGENAYVVENNWICPRNDMGEKDIYETYKQFPKELIDNFIKDFFGKMHNPEEAYGGMFHTIVSLEDLDTGEMYINYDVRYEEITKRYSDKVKGFIKKQSDIYSYCRKKDNKPLSSIPFSEMDEYELGLIKQLDNLWKDYQE